jgi:choline kinase
MIIIIAAAGEGRRLNKHKPKIMIEVTGKTILQHQLAAFSPSDEIRLVVGYQADEVIKLAFNLNKNIKIFVNEKFLTTGVPYSFCMACEDIDENVLLVDGDLIFDKETVDRFRLVKSGIGVCNITTENAVKCLVSDGQICTFGRGDHEWACICKIHPSVLMKNDRFVCDSLARKLPTPAIPVHRVEIDTPADLENAERILLNNELGNM